MWGPQRELPDSSLLERLLSESQTRDSEARLKQ